MADVINGKYSSKKVTTELNCGPTKIINTKLNSCSGIGMQTKDLRVSDGIQGKKLHLIIFPVPGN